MLDKLKSRTETFEFYLPHEIPQNRDCFLNPGDSLSIIVDQWVEYDENYVYETWQHPHELMDYIPCAVTSATEQFINLKILIQRRDRFHSVKLLLPTSKIVASFLPYTSEKRPYIIVDQHWFDRIRNYSYSSYAMIDFIGIRDILAVNGEMDSDKIIRLRALIDQKSEKYPQCIFLTLADNIIIKESWESNETDSNYNPENFFKIVNEIILTLQDELSIDAYAIFTQGANYVNEKEIDAESSRPSNHFFLPSIAVPFIEAFEIDENIRIEIRAGNISKARFYLENSFYISMHRNFFSSEEPDWFNMHSFFSSKINSEIQYAPVSYEELAHLVDLETNR